MPCVFCEKDKIKQEIMLETENFYLVPALGSFVPDYLLIVSQIHIDSLGQILTDEKINEEFNKLLGQVKKFLHAKHQNVIVFEHGAVNNDKAGCCIGHAHIHILPFDKKIAEKIEKVLGQKTLVNKYDELHEATGCGSVTYLLLEEENNIHIWKNVNVISQFMRRMIAKEVNCPECFDWKTHPYKEVMEQTIKSWKEFFQ